MILVEKKALKGKKNCLVMVILRRRNFSLSEIRFYLKKKYLLFRFKKLRLQKLRFKRLKNRLLNRYVYVLSNKNSKAFRSYQRSLT